LGEPGSAIPPLENLSLAHGQAPLQPKRRLLNTPPKVPGGALPPIQGQSYQSPHSNPKSHPIASRHPGYVQNPNYYEPIDLVAILPSDVYNYGPGYQEPGQTSTGYQPSNEPPVPDLRDHGTRRLHGSKCVTSSCMQYDEWYYPGEKCIHCQALFH
jgi:hypothetical protein